MLVKFKVALISACIAAVVSYPALADIDAAKKIIPVLSMLLLDDEEATFPEEAVIEFGENGKVDAFVGKDIDADIRVSENSIITTNSYQFELTSGPAGASVTDVGVIHFIPTATTPLGENTFEVKVIRISDGAEKVVSFTVFVMETEIVATGSIGPAGGTISDDWQEVVLHVPANAVTVLSTFTVLRGINEDLVYVYGVLEPANVTKGLSIRLPHPELRGADHDPYPAPASGRLASQSLHMPMAREATGGWEEWDNWSARFVRNTDGLNAINRLRNDLPDGHEPANNDMETFHDGDASKLYSLCSKEQYFTDCGVKDPILFIHGFNQGGGLGGGEETWGQLPELVSNIDQDTDGETDYAVFEFSWKTNARFVDVADDLAAAIELITEKSGYKVHIVAHSFGGLLARTYLQGHAVNWPYKNNVETLVTLGTPHSGIFDTAGTYHKKDFPNGQDSTSFEVCQQISCNQAGEPTPGAWEVDRVGLSEPINFSFYFGVNQEQGELISKLDDNKESLPVDTLVLMGLPFLDGLLNKYAYGDGLISFAGQKFAREWANNIIHPSPVALQGSNSTVTEKIMGFSDLDPNAKPAATPSSNLISHLSDFRGYFHTKKTGYATGYASPIAEAYVENTDNVPGFDRPHAAYTEIKAWLDNHPSYPITIPKLPLTITVVDSTTSAPVSGAEVDLGINSTLKSGVTDANGQVTINLPFVPYKSYTANVKASGYHTERHDTGYRTAATIAESSTDFGTIKLAGEVIAYAPISGTITDEDTGLGVPGVNYTLSRNTISYSGVTDASGNYSQVNLVTGIYKLTLTKPGYVTTWFKAFIIEGENNITNATLKPGSFTALNDTGITWGGDYPSGNNATCTSNMIIGSGPNAGNQLSQDCNAGRDVTHNDDSDGHVGFSFTKLDVDGTPLSAGATSWSCVKDNVTGLMWEVKENMDGVADTTNIHDADNTYRWGGVTHEGSNYGTYYPDWDSLVNGSNAGSGLCGYSDWRVPSINKLESLANLNQTNPAIDTAYFPNTPASGFWSASPGAGGSSSAWNVGFYSGNSGSSARYLSNHVRLVRSGQ